MLRVTALQRMRRSAFSSVTPLLSTASSTKTPSIFSRSFLLSSKPTLAGGHHHDHHAPAPVDNSSWMDRDEKLVLQYELTEDEQDFGYAETEHATFLGVNWKKGYEYEGWEVPFFATYFVVCVGLWLGVEYGAPKSPYLWAREEVLHSDFQPPQVAPWPEGYETDPVPVPGYLKKAHH